METASCKMAEQALVIKDISPKIKLVPRPMMMATPMVMRNSRGSKNDVVEKIKITKISGTAIKRIF